MTTDALNLQVQWIPVDTADLSRLPQHFRLPPLAKGYTQPVEVGDLIELSPESIWRIVQRKWRSAGPNLVHLTLWVEPAEHPRGGASIGEMQLTLH